MEETDPIAFLPAELRDADAEPTAVEKLTGAKGKPKKAAAPKPRARGRKADPEPAAGPPGGKADDGMPLQPGNRDDAAELDHGTRTAGMGPPPAAGAATPETPELRATRLERENAELRAALEDFVPEAARKALGLVAAPAGGAAADDTPGAGPVVWEGHIAGNKLFHHGKPFRFRSTESEAEAREAYQKLNGITSTTGKVVVRRA